MKIKEIVKEVATQVGTIQAVTPQGEVTMKNADGSEIKTTKDAFIPTTDPSTVAMKPGDGVDVGDKVTTPDTTQQEAQDGESTSADAILGKIAADEDWDLMYKLHSNAGNPKVPEEMRAAGKMIAQMYDDVTVDHPELHPDDDFEDIYNQVLDRIISDYSTQEEPANTDIETTETHDHDRDELGQGPIGGDRTDDFINDVSSEIGGDLEEAPDAQLAALQQMLSQVQEPWEKKQIEWRIQNQQNRNAPGIDMGNPVSAGGQLKPVVEPREWIKQNPNLAQTLPNDAKPPEMQTPGMLDRIKNLAGLK